MLCVLIFSTLTFAAAPDRITGPIVSSQLSKLSVGVSLKAQPQYDRGPVDPTFKLGYLTLLTVPSASQQKAIQQLLAQQQDPRSPLYHKWLTSEQYADRFGLSSNDIQKIAAWLQSQGFSVREVARDRNFIVFSGTASQVENTFQTQIHNFDVDAEKHFSNTTPPSIPSALSGVVTAIRGLNNFRAKSQALHSKPDYTLPVTGGDVFLMAPGDLVTVYDIQPLYTAGIDGTNQTLAVIGETDVYLADLNDFRSGFGLPTISGCTLNANLVITACDSTNFQYVLATGNTDPGSPNSVQDDLLEADIDLEYSAAMAPKAKIVYVNAPDPINGGGVYQSMYYTIDNNLAPVMTMSYTFGCELDEAEGGTLTADEAEFAAANTKGITFLNSSGDSGAAECDFQTNFPTGGYALAYPPSSPSITGVGGTLIPYTNYTTTGTNPYWTTSNSASGASATQYVPEETWNDAQESAEYCTANGSNTFCTGNSITSWATAQTSLGVLADGGGASNCITVNNLGVCTGGQAQPTWQQNLIIQGQTTTVHSTTGVLPVRFSPDVSLQASLYWPGFILCTPISEIGAGSSNASICAPGGANGILSSLNTYGLRVGGTSVATPIFAGIVTLLNQYLVTNGFQGAPGLGNANPGLYQIATYNQSAFHQVKIGSNGAWCSPLTPSNQPPALQCPAAVAPATEGFLGFDASNFDPTTGYNLATGLGSVNANNLATAWGELLTASTTTLSPSSAQIVEGTSETFTITVTPSSASGVVALYNNGSTTALGTATVSAGTGTFTTTALPAGTDSITGSYVGTNAFSTSSAVIVAVTEPDFTLANTGSTSVTVSAGVQATGYAFTVAPKAPATTFGATVTLSCSFAPTDPTLTNSSCVFNPSSIPGTNGSTPVTLTITTSGPNTAATKPQLHARADNRSPWLPFTLPIAGVVMVGFAGRKISKHSAITGLCVSLVLLGLLAACGGSSTPPVAVNAVAGVPSSLFPNHNGWPTQTAQFSATVTNTSNTAVTWAVTTANGGSIDPNSGVYTAPNVAAGLPTSVTITATSVADSTKSGSTTETLKAATVPGIYNVTVTVTDTTPAPTTHTLSPVLAMTVQ